MEEIKLESELLEPLIIKNSYNNISFFLKIKDYLYSGKDKSYFNDPKYQKVFNIMVKWHDKFKALPKKKDLELFFEKSESDEDIRFFFLQIIEDIFKDDELSKEYTPEFIEEEIKDFIIQARAVEATMLSQIDIEAGNYSKIADRMKEAITINFDKDLGTSIKDLHKIKTVIEEKQREGLVSTGFKTLDMKLGGGVAGGEIFVIGAPPKVGKTLLLGNIALNSFKQGKNVLVYTLEVSDARLFGRLYKNLFNTSTSDFFKDDFEESHKDDFINDVGDLIVKQHQANSASSNDFLAHINDLRTYKNWKPDVIIIDYLLIMRTNDFKMSVENTFKYYKTVTEEMRNLATELNVPIFTASQMNRGSMDERGGTKAVISSAAIAESRGIIDTCDYFTTLIQTSAQKKSDLMRLYAGEMRNTEGHFYIDLSVNYDRMKVEEVQ